MHFTTINALIKGIQETNDLNTLEIFKENEIVAFKLIKNMAFSEEKIDFDMVASIIEELLPILKKKINNAV